MKTLNQELFCNVELRNHASMHYEPFDEEEAAEEVVGFLYCHPHRWQLRVISPVTVDELAQWAAEHRAESNYVYSAEIPTEGDLRA